MSVKKKKKTESNISRTDNMYNILCVQQKYKNSSTQNVLL